MRTMVKVNIQTLLNTIHEWESYILSWSIARGRDIRIYEREHSKAIIQGQETQDNTGSTGSEHGNMHRSGREDTREYYTINKR